MAKPRDPEATKAAIVAAARACFMAKGRSGTSMSEIATKAGVAQSLLHHYFGNKDRLWDAVASAELRDYVGPQQKLLAAPNEPGKVEASFRSYFDFLRNNPETRRLLGWLALESGGPDQRDFDELSEPAAQRLRQAQALGIVRDDIAPEFILLVFRLLVQGWFADPVRPRDLADATQEELDQAYIDAAWKMFSSMVEKR